MMTTVDGFPIQVCDTGPEKGSVVVLLCAAQRALPAYDAVCERLHTASLRTIAIAPDPRLTPKSVMGILDVLDVSWGVLVGDRDGAELAWELAATRLDRFTGLVVIDRGHPRVADLAGVVRDNDCPPVEINTTRSGQQLRGARGGSGQPAVRLRRLPGGRVARTTQRARVDGATGRRDRPAHQHLVTDTDHAVNLSRDGLERLVARR